MRRKINIILGAVIAILSGCKTPQEAVKQDNRTVVLYGPPAVFTPADSPSSESQTSPREKVEKIELHGESQIIQRTTPRK